MYLLHTRWRWWMGKSTNFAGHSPFSPVYRKEIMNWVIIITLRHLLLVFVLTRLNLLVVDNWAMTIVLFTLAVNYELTLEKVIMEMRALVYVILNISSPCQQGVLAVVWAVDWIGC